jgi:hypothetical protein
MARKGESKRGRAASERHYRYPATQPQLRLLNRSSAQEQGRFRHPLWNEKPGGLLWGTRRL